MTCLNSGSWLHTLSMFIYCMITSACLQTSMKCLGNLNYSTWQNIMNMCLTMNLIIQHIKWPWIVYIFFSLLWHFYNFKYLPMQTLINIVTCMCIWKSNLITTKPEGMITTCTIEHTFSMYTITRRYKRSIKTKVSEVTTNLMNNI